MPDSSPQWWDSVHAALAVGKQLGATNREFNSACDHITQLLDDSSTMLERGSHGTATFLAITSLEETAKVHMGMYRRSSNPVKRSKDPLYSHEQKHRIALGPTVAMGSRLQAAIGEARMHELIELARYGGFIPLREASLYVQQVGDSLQTPLEVTPRQVAREVLLLAVEAFDDALVGHTEHTYSLGERTNSIFSRWASEA
jgi:AbiV family abortive infection protein